MNVGIRRSAAALPPRVRGILRVAVLVCALGGLAAPWAYAFYPLGGFTADGQLRYIRWARSYMDTNLDGDVSGPDEGVEITFEGGEFGWTEEELATLESAFDVWENIPTSHIAFRFNPAGPVPDPLGLNGNGVNDLLNYISIELPNDPLPSGAVGGGVLGVTFITSVFEDSQITVGDISFPVTGGQIIETDVVFDGEAVRQLIPGSDAPIDLFAVAVHEFGHVLGIGHVPHHNLEFVTSGIHAEDVLIESPAVAMRDATGVLQVVGATSTMFPFYFITVNQGGDSVAGSGDLAPEDVITASVMYPRGILDNYFNITGESRTQTRRNFPSAPVCGGIVTAWCDTDNDPLTRRIPLFSTMTGLFEAPDKPLLKGKLRLVGLMKEIEDFVGTAFQTSYTLTFHPLNGLDPAVPFPPTAFDPTHDPFINPGSERDSSDYNLVFPSEVFHEGNNIFGVEKHDLGTPLVYDPATNKVVSGVTGTTLAQILGPRPLFGDQTEMCPFNVTTAGLKSDHGPQALRGLRDGLLLPTAMGSALVNAYYHAAPSVAGFLLRHSWALSAARGVARMVEWGMENGRMALAGTATVLLMGAALCLRRRAVRGRASGVAAGAATLAIVCAALWAGPSHALLLYMTTPELVALADDIVDGTVTAVDSHWSDDGRHLAVTDITISVNDTIKGRLNKGADVIFRQPGGRVGDISTYAAELPAFVSGERVIVYLRYVPNYGYAVAGGIRGKYIVRATNAKGGSGAGSKNAEYIYAQNPAAAAGLADVPVRGGSDTASGEKKADRADDGRVVQSKTDGGIPLEDYKAYLRGLVKAQKSQKAQVGAQEVEAK